MKDHSKWAFWIMTLLIDILIVLICIAKEQDRANIQKLDETHAAELEACRKTALKGETCRIEYLSDRTGTIYGARVVRETE